MYSWIRSLRSRSLWSLRISVFQKSLNIPLSYKIRLNQVSPANKIHPYNHFSEYFLYFCRYITLIWELSMAYPPRLQAHNYQMIRAWRRYYSYTDSSPRAAVRWREPWKRHLRGRRWCWLPTSLCTPRRHWRRFAPSSTWSSPTCFWATAAALSSPRCWLQWWAFLPCSAIRIS